MNSKKIATVRCGRIEAVGSKNATIGATGKELINKFGMPTASNQTLIKNEIVFLISGLDLGKNVFVRIYKKDDEIKASDDNDLFSLSILIFDESNKCLNDGLDGFGYWNKNKEIESKILDKLKQKFQLKYI